MPGHRVQALAVIAVILLITTGWGSPGGAATRITEPPSDDSRTAHFVFNNEGGDSYNITLYIVENDTTEPYFPLEITYENGTTTTYSVYNPAVLFASPDLEEVEPADGTILATRQELPAHSSLHIRVKNVPANAKSLTIATGERPGVVERSLSDSVCTGSQADVMWFNESSTSAELCGNVSDVSSRDSRTHQVILNTTTEKEYR